MTSTNAAVFDAWARRGAGAKMEEAHSHAGKKVLDQIKIGYDESFIDLGCGNGWATRYVAEKVPTIGLCVGVDISGELIQEARRLSGGRFPVKFLVAPMEEVPFGEASFNYAFSMEALYYAADPPTVLRAVWRLLKMGGRFHLVIDYYKENPLSAAWQSDMELRMSYLSEREWVADFEKAGFASVKAERVLDERPVPPDLVFPWGGFATPEDLARFRTTIGSLHIVGRKAELSHALDLFLDRAHSGLEAEGRRDSGATGKSQPTKGKKRFGQR